MNLFNLPIDIKLFLVYYNDIENNYLKVLMMADQKGKIYERLYKIYELGTFYND